MFASLRRSFAGEVQTSPFVRRCYATAAGIYVQRPRAVAFPAAAEDVRRAVAFCRERGLPLTARGAGSGMAGNNVGRGLVLDLSRHLDRVLRADEAGRARAEPGVTYSALNAALAPHGRCLPPDPSSGAFCTLGGMVANNASGMRSVKYGSTAAWVTALAGVWGTGEPFEVRRPDSCEGRGGTAPDSAAHRAGASVESAPCEGGAPAPSAAADGVARDPVARDPVVERLERLFRESLPPPPGWIPRVTKNSAGLRSWPAWDGARLDPVELLVGSEGTLAVFTEIEVATAPLPGGRALLLAAFRSLDDMARAVESVRRVAPSGIEFLDETFLEALRSGHSGARAAIPEAARAVLFVETEGPTPELAARVARDALEAIGPLALPGARLAQDRAAAERLWSLRRGASPSLARLHPGRATQQFVEDCAVPPGALPELLRGLRRVFAAEGIPVVLFGHAGESHVHANPLFDPEDPRLGERIDRVADQVCELVDELEGTLSGEHGDGLARAAFARRRFGEAAEFFAAVREVCDPDGILNPGKILPGPGWRTGRDLRLPWERRARAARERWWHGKRAARAAEGASFAIQDPANGPRGRPAMRDAGARGQGGSPQQRPS